MNARKLLRVSAWITVICTTLAGAIYGGIILKSFSAFLGLTAVGLVVGLVSSAVYFGIAQIIEYQEELIKLSKSEAQNLSSPQAKNLTQSQVNTATKNGTNKTCSGCKKEYDILYSSCPHCGHRD